MDAKPILAAIIPAAIIVAIFLPIENILGSNNVVNPNQSPSEYCIVESSSSGGNAHTYQLCVVNVQADPDNLSIGNAKGNAHTRT
jgi:hypothetical protein